MNRPNPFASQSLFKPASEYLGAQFGAKPRPHSKSPSLEELDTEIGMLDNTDMDDRVSRSIYQDSTELTPRSIPLISLSRSPSPYPRNRSAAQSEDEDEFEHGEVAQSRPLVANDIATGSRERKKFFQRGGLGHFLFGTSIGWQVYVGLLVFWVGGCQFGLLLMNRFILWTGTYK